ncbi:MAG TPA: efflux RND transporter periplasmic adaptor subunit [Paludibacteraceae bacterium]|nr:efflux RND transporter periplasmic adaptor subunit [Paludibacteraceae bacterium]
MKSIKHLSYVAIALIALTGCNGGSDNKENAQEVAKVDTFKVKVDSVKTQPVEQIKEFTATVEPQIKNNIAPTAPGRIMEILTEVGHNVQKGQLLVKMDPTALLNQKAQLTNIELEYNRAEELRKAGGASQQVVDQLKTQMEVAKASYQNLLENANLKSPISGVVTARNFDSGDLYSNSANPILTVMQINPVKLIINVSESYFTNIKNGMKVDVTTDVFGDKKFPGKVSLIYPTIDEKTRTFPVEISIPNNNGAIRPGMFARVSMNFGTKNHIVVPDNAIVKRAGSGDRYIYVYNNDGTVSYDKVELGRRMGAEYELVSGIENGAVIVTSGQAKLNDGAKVEVIR